MGCLNAEQAGPDWHWFGNIHLSGPCNRSCYFCIGQHMMALDGFDVLDVFPLPGLDEFVAECRRQDVGEVNLTGTNTDPLLYRHHRRLTSHLREAMPGVTLGIRTNAVADLSVLSLYDKGSVTVCSFDPVIYRQMMGSGRPPNLGAVLELLADVKVNVVLGPHNTSPHNSSGPHSSGGVPDIFGTLKVLAGLGVRRVNLREPYGQPHVGDPLAGVLERSGEVWGMPTYRCDNECAAGGSLEVTYWDVHTVHVESVNLYASGRVSTTYPITLGHAQDGEVHDQQWFGERAGRRRQQWISSS